MVGEFVVVVRCRDCIHRPVEVRPYWYLPPKKEWGGKLYDDLTCPYVDTMSEDHEYTDMPEDEWFCSHGEKRKDD